MTIPFDLFSMLREDMLNLDSKEFDKYKAANPDAKPLKYGPEMKRQWTKLLNGVIVPLGDELR